MATRKKKSNWIDNQAAELTEAFANVTFDEKTKKVKWPKVTIGSHSTRTEYEDGRVEFVTDWEALRRDVRDAIASYEAENGKAEIRPPVKARSVRKKVAR